MLVVIRRVVRTSFRGGLSEQAEVLSWLQEQAEVLGGLQEVLAGL